MTGGWLAADRTELAAGRILDVAERLFVADGVSTVTMRQVATAAGCSRATLYRYFPSREALLSAYVDRAAREVARSVTAAAAHSAADDRLLVAITSALAGVRANPALLAWFTPSVAGTATDLALGSPAIERIVGEFLGARAASPDDVLRGQWLVRVVVSLLTRPGDSPAAEAELLRRFVLPVVSAP